MEINGSRRQFSSLEKIKTWEASDFKRFLLYGFCVLSKSADCQTVYLFFNSSKTATVLLERSSDSPQKSADVLSK